MKSFSLVLCTVLVLILSTVAGCQKTTDYQDYATITGFDTRTCSCCGGLYMNLYSNRTTVIANSYIIKNSPASLGIDSHTVFPLYLYIDWKTVSPDSCAQDITITSFKKP
jgi:hypothetical protein